MEIWIGTRRDEFQIPVMPSAFSFNNSIVTNNTHINDLGQISLFGGKALSTLTFSSFFPAQKYSFVEGRLEKPYQLVDTIKTWQDNGLVIRVLITETDINMTCLVETFTYEERDGSGDVYYSITFKEYRVPTIKKPVTSDTDTNEENREVETEKKEENEKYIVKSGDSLWSIAASKYGDGSRWTEIRDANPSITNPNLISIGMELIIP